MFKETPQGTTHFQNDGCKEHTDPVILKFREKFDKYRYESVPNDIDVPINEIEQFILQALAEQKKVIEKEHLMAISKRAGQEFYEEWKKEIIKKVSKRVLKYEGELFRGDEVIKIIR